MHRSAATFAVLFCLLASMASAADYTVGDIQIVGPWARATPRGANVAAGYFKITNKGTVSDRLIGGSAKVASRFEVHSMVIEDGVAKMRPVEGGLEIKPRETVELMPGSLHVMLFGVTKGIQAGQRVSGTLVFERAGKVEIEFAVVPMGQSGPGQHSGH